MVNKTKSIIEQLRAAIQKAEKGGDTMYRIAQRAGIERAQLTRLMKGTVAPRIDTTERIAEAIGFHVVLMPRKEEP